MESDQPEDDPDAWLATGRRLLLRPRGSGFVIQAACGALPVELIITIAVIR